MYFYSRNAGEETDMNRTKQVEREHLSERTESGIFSVDASQGTAFADCAQNMQMKNRNQSTPVALLCEPFLQLACLLERIMQSICHLQDH
jgi:hypothetical protein